MAGTMLSGLVEKRAELAGEIRPLEDRLAPTCRL